MTEALWESLRRCANEIGAAVSEHRGRGYSGQRETQYHLDLAADEVALRILGGAGFTVVSEESGRSEGANGYVVVVDPIDGSTNCDRGVPFFASSFAVMKNRELVAALVINQATGTVFEAERGGGATRDGRPIHPSATTSLDEALCAFSGLPDRHLGWAQYRALGAASLEICLVADGSLDVYGVAQRSTLHPWDYLGGLLVLREAGGVAGEYRGDELVIEAMTPRRPVFAATPNLLSTFLEAGVL